MPREVSRGTRTMSLITALAMTALILTAVAQVMVVTR